MKKEIISEMEEFAKRVLKGRENVSPQETAILPKVLKILQKETTGKPDGQSLSMQKNFNK